MYNEIVEKENEFVLNELRHILKKDDYFPSSEKEICGQILFTAYLPTEFNSPDSKKRARAIAEEIGSQWLDVSIQKIYEEFLKAIDKDLWIKPRFVDDWGTWEEDLSLQHLQSRLRMTTNYFLS